MTAPTPRTNDTFALTPQPTPTAAPALAFDWPAVRIGVAEYLEGPTGCTVLHFPGRVAVAVDVRGGSPGLFGDYGTADAICLAGGSLCGIEAIAGVAAEQFAQRGYSPHWDHTPLVSGGVIYDWLRDNRIYPDKELGRAALRWARSGWFPIGRCGAGSNARVGTGFDAEGSEWGGQGAAFRQVGDTKIAVFTVVNALGVVVDRTGKVVRGQRDAATGTRLTVADDLERRIAAGLPTAPVPGNTTLTVVVTNQKIETHPLQQLGRSVHASMARAIQPFHTLGDGDILWAATTNETGNHALSPLALGVLAAELAWDAVLSAVREPLSP